MKVLLVLACLVSASAFAETVVVAPKLWFGRFMYNVTDLCIEGDSIRPNQPDVEECTGDIDSNCNPQMVHLTRKLAYEAEVCTVPNIDSADCPSNSTEMRPFIILKNYELDEFSWSASGEYESATPIGKIKYTVPNCQ